MPLLLAGGGGEETLFVEGTVNRKEENLRLLSHLRLRIRPHLEGEGQGSMFCTVMEA
jgi:hypothetical protein